MTSNETDARLWASFDRVFQPLCDEFVRRQTDPHAAAVRVGEIGPIDLFAREGIGGPVVMRVPYPWEDRRGAIVVRSDLLKNNDDLDAAMATGIAAHLYQTPLARRISQEGTHFVPTAIPRDRYMWMAGGPATALSTQSAEAGLYRTAVRDAWDLAHTVSPNGKSLREAHDRLGSQLMKDPQLRVVRRLLMQLAVVMRDVGSVAPRALGNVLHNWSNHVMDTALQTPRQVRGERQRREREMVDSSTQQTPEPAQLQERDTTPVLESSAAAAPARDLSIA